MFSSSLCLFFKDTSCNICCVNKSGWQFSFPVSLRADTRFWLTVSKTDQTASSSNKETSSNYNVKTTGGAGEFSATWFSANPVKGGLVISRTVPVWMDAVIFLPSCKHFPHNSSSSWRKKAGEKSDCATRGLHISRLPAAHYRRQRPRKRLQTRG